MTMKFRTTTGRTIQATKEEVELITTLEARGFAIDDLHIEGRIGYLTMSDGEKLEYLLDGMDGLG